MNLLLNFQQSIISLPYVNTRLYPVLEISFHPHYVMGACQEGHRLLVSFYFLTRLTLFDSICLFVIDFVYSFCLLFCLPMYYCFHMMGAKWSFITKALLFYNYIFDILSFCIIMNVGLKSRRLKKEDEISQIILLLNFEKYNFCAKVFDMVTS